ncbi:oligosaccharide repeat unit polymerase [Pseudoalteromonas haloplanktis]|uniref:Oligosaccharide repeat unit polymerase n=1 Tax=Pseudoalteromonas haloplanktis TaxID=228 RepID=A0ABU1BHT3_PSEHA|nr:oligosaccharide repeat unit polymerase [Pseudoalteromonas haloplanktis]MDQ9094043.1 oligosaccharide repeat unit polymerase [Pseudoalteromonas haloplanktis]
MHIFISFLLSMMITLLVVLTDTMEALVWVVDIFLIIFIIAKFYLYPRIKVDFFNIVYIGFLFLIYVDINSPPQQFEASIELEAAKLIVLSFFILLSTLLIRQEIHNTGETDCFIPYKVTLGQKCFLFFLWGLYLVGMSPAAIEGLLFGRHSTTLSGSWTEQYYTYLVAISYVLPGYFALIYKKKLISLKTLLSLTVPIFIIEISTGTRFVFLFSFFIFSTFIFDFENLKKRNVLLIFLMFLSVSVLMKDVRSGGIANDEYEQALIEKILHSEGLLFYFSGLVKYYKSHEHSYLPIQSSFVTYFYIPRSVWPDKPQLVGSWILDTGVFNQNFSNRHSGSVTFLGPFYSDFGYVSLFLVFWLGVLLSKVEKVYFINVRKYNLVAIVAASTVPTLFFGLRSFNTSMLTFAVICFLTIIYALLGFDSKKLVR